MKRIPIELSATGLYPELLQDYLADAPALRPFYAARPNREGLAQALQARQAFPQEQRQALQAALRRQYAEAGIALNEAQQQHLEALGQPNTFTITTGHQLNLASGPLYVVYKWLSTILLARKAEVWFPEYRFVPLYWMAGEDHDFAEINHFSLFQKTYTWPREGKGPVGLLPLEGLDEVWSQLPEAIPLLEEAYGSARTLGEATRKLVQNLLGEEGLLCLDPMDRELKRSLAPLFRQELWESPYETLCLTQTEALQQAGYKAQIKPRPLNLFYAEAGLRERIVRERERWQVLNTELSFSASELETLLETRPEVFSPNVVLRPLCQEWLLPNVAYIGGPAELHYWMQLGSAFAHAGLPMPVLWPRLMAQVLTSAQVQRWESLGFGLEQLFDSAENLKTRYLNKQGGVPSFQQERVTLDGLVHSLATRARQADPTLLDFTKAEGAKMLKSLEFIEKRVQKAEEKKHEVALGKIANLKARLFPDEGPQERSDNFFGIWLNHPTFLQDLARCPVDEFRLNLLILD